MSFPLPSSPHWVPIGRGQHQHPSARAGGDQCAADLVAVQPGEVAVEHDDVIGVLDPVTEPFLPVERDVDRHSLAPQTVRDRHGQVPVVLDDQHAHALQR